MLDPVHDRVLHTYLRAKDENRPFLLAEAFASQARFETTFASASDFEQGAPSEGLAAITATFRELGAMCENIFTVCTTESIEDGSDTLVCKWVVAMSERETGRVRVGWGDYRWRFDTRSGLATELLVNMQRMVVLDPATADGVLGWISALPLPWCTTAQLLRRVPALTELDELRAYFA